MEEKEEVSKVHIAPKQELKVIVYEEMWKKGTCRLAFDVVHQDMEYYFIIWTPKQQKKYDN